MELSTMDLQRSAFGATGLSGATWSRPRPAEAEAPVDRVERSEAPAPPSPDVRVRYNPQDSTVMPAVETTVPRGDIGRDLSNPRMKMDDGATATPDQNGSYLFAPGTKNYQQSQSFVSTERTLRLFEQAVGHEIPWAFSGKLAIHPHAGNDFNAYYSRQDKSTNFFDGSDPIRNATIHASESLDVVSHETGHAILDGMKPGMLGWFGSLEGEAFHESFGDVAAFLTSLQDDAALQRLADQTGGDLHKDNFMAHLAEDLSLGINNAYFGGKKPEGWTIRNANNGLTYKDPKNLPSNPPDETQLGKEAHNFSRLYTAAVWDVMAGITQKEMANGKSPKDAIAAARDVMLPLYARSVELGPNRMKKYREMADAMVAADKRDFKGAHVDLIQKVFADRGIRPASTELTAAEPPAITLEQPIRSDSDAVDFLADHRHHLGVPGDVPLRPAARWSNDRGETFVRYDYQQDAKVGGDLSTTLVGSLTVAFDGDNKLFHSLWEPIDAEQVALANDAVEFHLAEGDIHTGHDLMKSVKPDNHPWLGYVATTADGDKRIVRIPATTWSTSPDR